MYLTEYKKLYYAEKIDEMISILSQIKHYSDAFWGLKNNREQSNVTVDKAIEQLDYLQMLLREQSERA